LREAAVRARAFLWLAALVCAGLLTWGLLKWKKQPPEVQFVRVTRQTIHSSVPTNGKVEPIEWAIAHAERAGPVEKILIQRSQNVAKDQPLVELDSTEARGNLLAAQARIAQAKADLEVIARGGRSTDLAEVESGLKRAHLDLEQAQRDYDALQRLEAKQATTATEVNAAKARVDGAKLQIEAWERRRGALASTADRGAAQARLDDAEAAARVADLEIRQSVVRAPVEGTVYQFDLKPGAYLNAGDPVASIGRLDRVRVNVYVDEPDLGRVKKGMPVAITWDALPGHKWDGEVDRTPTQIQAMGTRQVGEVVCLIQNPDRDLLPGTNVNVEIRSQTVADALAIPKEAVRTEHAQTGVYLLVGDHIEWKKISVGIANTTRSQVEGLKEGDAVVSYSERALQDGMTVKALFPE
jgi:HlyD family secretion protein